MNLCHLQIADLRDSIGILSEILSETRATYDDLLKTMETINTDTTISSAHGEVLKDLHEKLTERRQVFMKRSIELARKQAWYRSVALGTHRRDLLCWMLGSIFKTLKVHRTSISPSCAGQTNGITTDERKMTYVSSTGCV